MKIQSTPRRIIKFAAFKKFLPICFALACPVFFVFTGNVLAGNLNNGRDSLATGNNSPVRPFWLNSIDNSEGTPAENLTSYVTVYGGKRFNIIEYKFLPGLFRGKELDSLREKIRTERKLIEERCKAAHSKGWKTFIRTYEVDYPKVLSQRRPEIIKDINKRLWFLESKIYEMFIEMPYLDGLNMTTSEAMASAETPELTAKYVEAAYNALKRVEKKTGKKKYLIIRTWRSGPRESATLKFYPLPLKKEIARKIIFDIKNTNGDFSMTNPFNPLIGKMKDSRRIMEFEVRGEYRGFNWFPVAMGKRWKAQLLKGIKNKVIGVAYQWVKFEWPKKNLKRIPGENWGSGYPWHNVWANLDSYTLTELVKNINQNPEDIYRKWIKLHFGKKAENPLLKILNLSYGVMSKILYTHGIKSTDHSAFANNDKNRSALDREDYTFAEYYSLFWSDAEKRIHIDAKNVQSMIHEKIEAVEGAEKMLKILQDNKDSFKDSDFLHLETSLKGLVNYAKANRYYMEGYLRYRLSKTFVGVKEQKEIDTIFTVVKKAHELQFEKPGFPGRIGPKNFTILLDTISGILLHDVPTYRTDWNLILNPPKSQ